MAEWWRAVVVASLAAAVVLTAAGNRDAGEPADGRPPPPEAPAKAATLVTADRAGLASAEPQHGSAAAASAEVDHLGTRRLTGRSGPTVALTFDDGPHPRHTPQVLDVLREHEVTATFCVVGHLVEARADLVRRIARDGHALCNHTMTHDMGLPGSATDRIDVEVRGTLDAITAAVPGAEIPFFRAPGGHFAADVNAVASGLGHTPLGWSVDTRDWRRPGAAAIRSRVLEQVHPGAVVLLHDGGGDRSGTVEALPGIITGLTDLGYEFVIPVG